MNLRLKFFLGIIILSIILISIYNHDLRNESHNKINLPNHLILNSHCACVTDKVEVNRFKSDYQIKVKQNKSILLEYEISVEAFKLLTFSCDLYSSLRRGFNQNIISFSLFGSNKFYYSLLEANVKAAKRLYPDWVIRVYHDNSINRSEMCKHQCLTDKTNNILLNNIDYCNVNNLIYQNKVKYYDYMLPMVWRYFKIIFHFM
jgi:hypothetical protein